MTNQPNSFPSSSNGRLFLLGLAAALTPFSSSIAALPVNQPSLRLDGATYTITSNAPTLGNTLQGGNIKNVSRYEPLETQIQILYSALYMNQKDLDSDMARILYTRLADLYEE
jgi:hypothetical protein